MDSDLLVSIGAQNADPAELEQVLIEHFKGASYIDDTEVWYGAGPHGHALRLIYREASLFADAGPTLKASDIEELRRKVALDLRHGPNKIGRQVLFSKIPVYGYFRYRSRFQLLPTPPDAPNSDPHIPFMMPFLVETGFSSSPNAIISLTRMNKALREVELLCAAFIWMPIQHIRDIRFTWVFEHEATEEPKSVRRQEGYYWKGYLRQLDDFSPTESVAPMSALPPDDYYGRRNYSVGQPLDVPSNLAWLLDIFYGLPAAERERFLRACYWLQHALNVWSESNSASFVALVSAVDALMPGNSSGQAFVEFMEALIPDKSVSPQQRKKFYSLRSALAHGGKLLHHDQLAWGINVPSVAELNQLASLSQIVRVVLYNWLLDQRTS